MDEEMVASVDTADVPADIPDDVSSDILDDVPEDVPEDIPEDAPSDVGDDISEDVPEDIPEDEPSDVGDDIPEDVPEDIPEDEPSDVGDDIPEGVPEDIPEDEPSNEENSEVEDQPTDVQEDVADDPAAAETDVAPADTEDGEVEDQPTDAPEDVTDNPAAEETDDAPADTEDGDTEEGPAYSSANDLPDKGNNSGDNSDAFSSLVDYMNSHDYGPQDFATYSQDPEWRALQKKAYPDYELPPLTQENAYNQLFDYMNSHNYGPQDFATYSQDPEWRDLQRQAFPDYELPPLNNVDNLGQWKEIPPDMSYKDNLDAANPNYDLGDEWKVNCQRCVPTYEMRSRGYDVTAQPCVDDDDYLSYHPYDVWENADVQSASGNGLNDIQNAMSGWGDGSRAQVCLQWDSGDGGHTFTAEQRNGKTYFVDPQTGDMDCGWYFDHASPGSVSFCRTDQLMPSSRILDCCKGVR